MLSFEPNIVVIDDQRAEIEGILSYYHQEGIGCKYYNAHLSDGDLKPDMPYSDVNLIFLDVYYTSGLDEYDPELCSGWIDALIPEYHFYILVIWSRDTEHKDEILQALKSIKKLPFKVIEAQKTDYTLQNSWDFSRLHEDIEKVMNKTVAIEEFGLWKKSIKTSANLIIGHLAQTQSLDKPKLRKRLQKIILGHGGSTYHQNGNTLQVREVLFDALDQILLSNAKGTRPNVEITDINKNNLYSINEKKIKDDIDTRLNSWFHFKLYDQSLLANKPLEPGTISSYQDENLIKLYSILDDKKIKDTLKDQINNIDTEILDICMLISRPCDVAQNKFGKNLKLISGLLIKKPKRKENGTKAFKTGTKPDSIKCFDHIYMSETDNDTVLVFDFRYIFSLPIDEYKKKLEHLKVFNKELLSEMQVEYSSYSSRLGITQII